MKSCLILVVAMLTQVASAQRPPIRIEGGRGDHRVVIRVDENERQDRDQDMRIRELEKAVRDLQYRVYDLEDKVIGNQPPIVPAGPECQLLGSGSYSGFTYNHRIAVDGNVVAAKDNFDSALETIKQFQNSGVCTPKAYNTQCTLLGSGSYSGFTYNFRIGLKKVSDGQVTVVAATDNQQNALNIMSKIRSTGLCQ